MLVLSLFPGIGLLDRAFEESGFCVVRGPDLLWGGDVATFHPPAGRFDGVIGGPPCQQFSPLVHLLRSQGREPKHGNLIPDFERVVGEAAPAWFLMENVPPAPLPQVAGYTVSAFLLCPTWLPDEDGFGHEQRRKRRFSFGVKGEVAPDLRRWIPLAALELADSARGVTAGPLVDNSDEAKGRTTVPAVISKESPGQRHKTNTVTGRSSDERRTKVGAVTTDSRETPVAIGGSGKYKRRTVRGKNDSNPQPFETNGGVLPHTGYRRPISEMARLQGLPEDFLSEAPFTSDGKRMVIGNGVPLSMGRALAKAILEATAASGPKVEQ